MVGQRTLDASIEVRLLVPQPWKAGQCRKILVSFSLLSRDENAGLSKAKEAGSRAYKIL